MEKKFWPMCVGVMGTYAVFALWCAHEVFMKGNCAIYQEYKLIENMQIFVLMATCVVFVLPPAFGKGSDKLIPAAGVLLGYSCVLRELEIKHLDVHWCLKLVGTGMGRSVILSVALVALLGYAVAHFSRSVKVSIDFIRSRSGILLMVGGVLILAGDVCEKSHSFSNDAFFEEILELWGYCLMMLSALSVKLT